MRNGVLSHRQKKCVSRAFVAAAVALTFTVMLSACAVSLLRGETVDAAVQGANYTDDYVDFTLMSPVGKNLGIGGSLNPFSRGGTGGLTCCAIVPGVGQSISVKFKVGRFNDAEDQYKKFNRNVVVKGSMPTEPETHSYLVVRFFSGHEVEAELFPYADHDPKNPRVDKLFLGQQVMRRIGE